MDARTPPKWSVPDQAPRKQRRPYTRAPRDLVPIDRTSGPARFYERMTREIEADLGGPKELTRIEHELVRAFAGAATQLRYINHQIMLGEGSAIDLSGFSQLASTMLRLGSKLGLGRRAKLVEESLHDVVDDYQEPTNDAAG
jgi:hypothetical protein